MGLKSDIFEALVSNIQPDNPGENFSFSDAAVDKVDVLAQDLTDAIVKWVKAQTFIVTSLNATQLATTTAPSLTVPTGIPQPPGAPAVPSTIPSLVIPKITVKVDENAAASDNPNSGVESMQSKVKLKRVVEV